MASIIETQKTIDKILGVVEDNLYGTTSPEEFSAGIDFEILLEQKHFHISRSKAKRKGAQWPMHIHKNSYETIIMTEGSGILVIDEQKLYIKAGESFTVPAGILHGGYALEDNTEIICVVVPSDKNTIFFKKMLDSAKNGRS